MSKVTLHLTEQQYLVFSEFLRNLRLGDYSEFATEMSNLAIDLDTEMDSTALGMMQNMYGKPSISVIASEEDGIVFEVN